MKKSLPKKILYFITFISANLFFSSNSISQNTGDYRSIVNSKANWNSSASWEKYNGTSWIASVDYPGQFSEAGNVTIRNGAEIALPITITKSITSLTIGELGKPAATLSFNPSKNNSNLTLNVLGNIDVVNGKFELEKKQGNNHHTLHIGGNLYVSSNSSFDMIYHNDDCNVYFNGSNISIGGGGTINFKNLNFSNNGNGIFTSNATVYGSLSVDRILEIYPGITLTLNSPSITGGPFSKDKHIVTLADNSGKKGVLAMNNIPVTGYTFPVGNGHYYMPATITPLSSGNSFGVSVFQGVTENGQPNGAAFTAERKKNLVDAVWDVNRLAGTGQVSLMVSWPDALEGESFRALGGEQIGISQNQGGNWSVVKGTGDNDLNTALRTGIESFSPHAVGQVNTMLPVRFSNVKASEKLAGVQIDFTNLTESDVEYYEIERSSDGRIFNSIKRLAPSRNDYNSVSYTYQDGSAAQGRTFYRIKAVEISGKEVYSNPISIIIGVKGNGNYFNVYASGGQVNIQVSSSLPAGRYQFKVFSTSGQVMSIENISHAGGSFSQSTPLNNVKSGLYIYTISGPVIMQKKFIVQ